MYIRQIIKALNEFYYRTKFKIFNYNLYFENNPKKKNIFLIEFNAFHDHHIAYSVFSNYFKKNFNCEIYAFFNGCLLFSDLIFNYLNQIKWIIGNYFSLKNFGVYKSFGAKKIFKPEINYKINLKVKKTYAQSYNKIKNKRNILELKLNNILVGDLLYDTYLKSKIQPTIDIKSEEFKKFYSDFLRLFFFWINYFKKKNILGIIVSHSCYSYAIPLRIALSKKIQVFIVNTKGITKVTNKTFCGPHLGNYKNYKKIFKKINKKIKNKIINKAKIIVNSKLNGMVGPKFNTESFDISSFSNIYGKTILKENKKFKVLIAPHDFFDAAHILGDTFFEDFYEWLKFLLLFSKNTNYDWYIKNHPIYSGKYAKYQPFSDQIVNIMIEQFNKEVTLIPNNISNKQLIKEGIGAVLTAYGSVAGEFPYYGIPVINASRNNPFCSYSFSVTPKSRMEYIKIIKNLPKLKVVKQAKNEILEHYSLRFLIENNNWLLHYNKMLTKIGGYHNMRSFHIYKYWIKYFKKEFLNKIYVNLDEFIKSNNIRLLKKDYQINV